MSIKIRVLETWFGNLAVLDRGDDFDYGLPTKEVRDQPVDPQLVDLVKRMFMAMEEPASGDHTNHREQG